MSAEGVTHSTMELTASRVVEGAWRARAGWEHTVARRVGRRALEVSWRSTKARAASKLQWKSLLLAN